MRTLLTGPATLLALALAGCDGPGERNVAVAGPDNVQNALEAMPESQRNGVFIRAIRDAGQECQHVESSVPAGQHEGFPVWNATCSRGGTWTIVIMNDGVAQVLNAEEAALAGSNQTATAGNAQGQ